MFPERNNHNNDVDMFPRTENALKSAFDLFLDGQNKKYILDIKVSLSFHVETVYFNVSSIGETTELMLER